MNAPTPPELDVRQQDGVLWLTLCRESRRNALSPGVLAGLTEALTLSLIHISEPTRPY